MCLTQNAGPAASLDMAWLGCNGGTCVFSRLGAMESISSMKMMAGAFFSASSKAFRRLLSLSPASLLMISGPLMRKKKAPVSLATALAISVFPAQRPEIANAESAKVRPAGRPCYAVLAVAQRWCPDFKSRVLHLILQCACMREAFQLLSRHHAREPLGRT